MKKQICILVLTIALAAGNLMADDKIVVLAVKVSPQQSRKIHLEAKVACPEGVTPKIAECFVLRLSAFRRSGIGNSFSSRVKFDRKSSLASFNVKGSQSSRDDVKLVFRLVGDNGVKSDEAETPVFSY